jgi:glucose/arabinose dehydrogenase
MVQTFAPDALAARAAGVSPRLSSAAGVRSRPAALAVMKDSSLLVADDTGGTIWRLSYAGSQRTQ